MRFVFPAVFAVFIALLFYEVYSLSHSLSEFDLPNPARPNPLHVLTPTPAPAPDVAPEPKLDAVAATLAPAPDVAAEPKLGAAPKAQSAPKVLRKVEPAAGRERAEAPPKKKHVTATGPYGAAGAITGRERARPPERDFGQSTGELPPQ